MLTITHTMTESDCALIKQDISRRMKADVIYKPLNQANRRARWPFRLATAAAGMFLLAIAPFQSDTEGKVTLLVLGGLLVGPYAIMLGIYLMVRLLALYYSWVQRGNIRRTVKWEFYDDGIAASKKIPLAAVRSAAFTKAGIVLLLKHHDLISPGAVPDPALKKRLREIKEIYTAHRTKDPLGPLPAFGRLFCFSSRFSCLGYKLLLIINGQKYMSRALDSRNAWHVDNEDNIVPKHFNPWAQYQSYEFADAGVILFDKKQIPKTYIPASAVSEASVRAELEKILKCHFTPPVIAA